MHPTRDTLLVIYLQSLGRAGDAWRYAAVWQTGAWLRGRRVAGDVSTARAGFGVTWTRHNKRMHATRDTLLVIFGKVVGGRVMRGVRRNG